VQEFLKSSAILASLLLHFGQLGAVAQEDRLKLRVVGSIVLGEPDSPSLPTAIKVIGHYAYVAAWPNTTNGFAGVEIFDVSDPANPVPVALYQTDRVTYDVAARGDFLFVTEGLTVKGANHSGMLEILDVSDPTVPLLVGAVNSSEPAGGLQISGDYGYLPTGSRGTDSNTVGVLEIFDLRDPGNPLRVGTYESGRSINSIQVNGDYAYFTDGQVDVQVLELSNPANPQSVGSFQTNFPNTYGSGPAWWVQLVSTNYICVTDGPESAYVLDIRNPVEPIFAARWPGGPVRVVGKYAFAFLIFTEADGTPHTYATTLDVSEPAHPVTLLAFAPIQNSWQGLPLTIIGNYAYVYTGEAGLLVVEITELPHIDSVSRSGSQLVLRWRGAPGMKLQRTDSLISRDWTDVLGSEGQSEVHLPLGSGPEFFRLVSP